MSEHKKKTEGKHSYTVVLLSPERKEVKVEVDAYTWGDAITEARHQHPDNYTVKADQEDPTPERSQADLRGEIHREVEVPEFKHEEGVAVEVDGAALEKGSFVMADRPGGKAAEKAGPEAQRAAENAYADSHATNPQNGPVTGMAIASKQREMDRARAEKEKGEKHKGHGRHANAENA